MNTMLTLLSGTVTLKNIRLQKHVSGILLAALACIPLAKAAREDSTPLEEKITFKELLDPTHEEASEFESFMKRVSGKGFMDYLGKMEEKTQITALQNLLEHTKGMPFEKCNCKQSKTTMQKISKCRTVEQKEDLGFYVTSYPSNGFPATESSSSVSPSAESWDVDTINEKYIELWRSGKEKFTVDGIRYGCGRCFNSGIDIKEFVVSRRGDGIRRPKRYFDNKDKNILSLLPLKHMDINNDGRHIFSDYEIYKRQKKEIKAAEERAEVRKVKQAKEKDTYKANLKVKIAPDYRYLKKYWLNDQLFIYDKGHYGSTIYVKVEKDMGNNTFAVRGVLGLHQGSWHKSNKYIENCDRKYLVNWEEQIKKGKNLRGELADSEEQEQKRKKYSASRWTKWRNGI